MRRLALLLALAACDQNMVQQPRADDYERSTLFGDGKVLQPPPDGTVARDSAPPPPRPPMTAALLARGRERYGIFCAMCHGAGGRGDGIVVSRGYPPPPSFLAPAQRAASPEHVYDVITRGYGVMYGYAARVSPADRWAIAAYVQALQRAGGDSRPSSPPPSSRRKPGPGTTARLDPGFRRDDRESRKA